MRIKKNLTAKRPINIKEGGIYLSKGGHKIILLRRNLGFYIWFHGVIGVNGVHIHGAWDACGKWKGADHLPGDFDVVHGDFDVALELEGQENET